MTSEMDKFLYTWAYNIERVLARQLDALQYDLDSSDEQLRERAEREIPEFRSWLDPPVKGKRGRGRPRTRANDAIRALTLHVSTTKSWRQIAMEVYGCEHACTKCGRRKGKPFEGGRKIGPCCPTCSGSLIRTKPDNERSCFACGDAVREAVGKLVKFLKRKRLYLPPLKDLERMSPAELQQLLSQACD